VSILPTLIQYSFGIHNQGNEQEEGIKLIQIGKEEVELSLFADDLILHIKISQKGFLSIINTFSKLERYKINI
jgi:hypothetical protein